MVSINKRNVNRGKSLNLEIDMASENNKRKAKNSYLGNANKTTAKLKRINFYIRLTDVMLKK